MGAYFSAEQALKYRNILVLHWTFTQDEGKWRGELGWGNIT